MNLIATTLTLVDGSTITAGSLTPDQVRDALGKTTTGDWLKIGTDYVRADKVTKIAA